MQKKLVVDLRTLNGTLGLMVVLVGLGFVPLSAAVVGPGSGSATVSPLTATVDTPGKWTIVYTSVDNFTNGTLRVTIPTGWTAPQNSSATTAGYVTVTSDGPVPAPPVSITGQEITITLSDLPKPKIVTVVYGDDTGGAGARATPPTASDPAAVFLVESDPLGTAVQPIAASPTVDLQPGTIVDLEFTNVAFVFQTTSEGGPYSVVARDTYDNPSPVTTNQQINLSTTSPGGTFSVLGGGAFSPVTRVTMTAGSHTATCYYRDTVAGSPMVTAAAAGQTWGTAEQTQAVNPGPIDAATSLVDAVSPVEADGVTQSQITVTARDGYGNPVSGAAVTLGVAPVGQGETLTQPPGLTDPSGQAFGGLKSTKTGSRTVNAVINSTAITDVAVVVFEPGEAASFQWGFTGGATAGVPKDVTLTVRDALNNIVTDFADTAFISTTSPGPEVWEMGGGAVGELDSLSNGQWFYLFNTGDNGSVALRVKVIRTGSITLFAENEDAEGTSASLNVSANVASQISKFSGDLQTAQVNTLVASDLVVLVKDAYNNPVGGAQVTFGNVTGGGSVDVVAGGGVDSVATTAADGKARCEDWRLGQTAGTNTVNARLVAGPSVTFSATGTHGPETQIVWTTTSQNVTVDSDTEVGAILKDTYGNPVPGVLLTIFISDSPDGLLKSNPADPNPTIPLGPTTRQGTTDTNGRITVLYEAPGTAGLSDVIDASGGSVGSGSVADLVFTSVASTLIDHYVFTLGKTTWTANELVSVQVRAFDQFNNPIDDDTTPVQLSSTTGNAQYTSASGPLTDGVFWTTAKSTVAEQLRLIVSTNGGEPRDTSVVVTVVAGPASGTITSAAVPGTITADGTSQSTVTSDPIRDASLNVVAPGTMIDVATSLGTIFSADQDPVRPGTQRATDSAGRISFVVRSGTTAETASVTMNAAPPGTAAGNKAIVFAPKPNLTASAPIPDVAIPGQSYEFDVDVTNTTTTACTLFTTTKLRFTDGVRNFSAELKPTSPRTVSGLGSRRISFQSTLIDANMAPGLYTPWIEASWKDRYGGLSTQTVFLTANSLRLVAIETKGVNPQPSVVTRGQQGDITVTVENKGPIAATILSVTFTFSVGNGHFDYESELTPSLNIPGASTRNVSIPVTVLQTAPVGITTVNAAVSGTVNGTPVSDPSLSPYPLAQWDIRSGAAIAYVDESLTPRVVSRGQTHGFKVQLTNTGDTTLELRTPGTKLSFTDGSILYEATLTQPEPIGSGATKEITFNSVQVPTGITADRAYDVKLHLEGVENLVPFPAFDLYTSVHDDSVTVVRPASVAYVAGSLTPTLVSQGVSVSFTVNVNNTGTAVVQLNPSQTTFSFGGSFTATLDPASDTTIENGVNTLRFVPTVVSTATGTFTPQFRLRGTENSLPYAPSDLSTSPNTVNVQPPASIGILSVEASQPSITVDQTKSITVTMRVKSNSGAAVRFDSTRVAFLLNGSQDRTFQFNIARPGGFFTNGATLPGGATDSLVFTISDNTGNTMTAGSYVIEGDLWVTPVAGGPQIHVDTDLGGKGNLLVQQPGILTITGVNPSRSTVTTGQTGWTVDVGVRNTGVAAVRLSLGAESTFITFVGGSGWSSSLQTSGPVTLGQNESTTLVYGATASSAPVVGAAIHGTVRGIELNSDVQKTAQTPPGQGSITVQTPAAIRITQVTKSRDPVTENQTTPWTIGVRVRNDGGATVDLSTLADSTYILFPDALSGGRITGPTGALSLPGSQETVLTFTVSPTPDFAGPGPKDFDVFVRGRELNRNLWLKAEASGSVEVQLKPDPQYVLPSLTPSAVKRGDQVQFSVRVTEIAGASQVLLTPSTTVLKFGTPPLEFRRSLDATKGTVITPGGTTTLWFEPGIVPLGFADGPQPVTVELRGTENGNTLQEDFIDIETVELRSPTAVRINTMIASRQTVSASQTTPWQVRMVVENMGSGEVSVESGTRLVLRIAPDDVTSQYQIDWNPVFEVSGTNRLAAGATDAIVFTILETGTKTGSMTINGIFAGKDVGAGTPIGDDTFDSGWTTVLVQTPGALVVTGIDASQTRVTVGQTAAWTATVRVQNTGQAGVRLTYGADAPEIRFAPESGFEWTRPDSAGVAGTVIAGGGTAALGFVVNKTGTQAGTPAIHAVVSGVDTNSVQATSYDTQTGGSGSGSIVVQSRGRAVVTSTTVVSPNEPEVNIGQVFGVRVEISNTGGANLEDVTYTISTTGGSTPQNATLVAPVIAAGEAAVGAFVVTADNTTGPETLTVDVLTGTDANSGQTGLLDVGPHVDQTEIVRKVEPSNLVIDSVTASQTTVTRSQTQDWYVNVAVTNTGGAALDIVTPATSDLAFLLGAQPLGGYVVIPPSRFVNRTGLSLGPGEVDVLRYTIDVTGADVGIVTLRAAVGWTDTNDLSTASVQNTGTVTVVEPSGLFINSTAADPATAPNDGPEPHTVHVNSGRLFTIEVNVRNLGAVEDVDNVQVRLVSTNPSSPLNRVSEFAEILRDQEYTFRFVDVNLGLLGPSEASRTVPLTSTIISARSKSTGQPITPGQPLDNAETVVIEKPANLSATVSVSDNTLSSGQDFTVTGGVVNSGVARVDDTGKIALILPAGFVKQGATPPDTVGFTVGSAVIWTVRAPAMAISGQPIQVKITTRPNDENIAAPAAVADSVATVLVDVLRQGGFDNTALEISAPAGATDHTVSTLQQFTLRATAVAEPTTTNIQAVLVLVNDPGVTVIDPLPRDLQNTGTLSVTWRVNAPANASTGTFRVEFQGKDVNTGDDVGLPTPERVVTIVERATLRVRGRIARPAEATDGRVAIGSRFEIDGGVSNWGQAGVVPAGARVRINFSQATGYSLYEGTAERSFTLGETITWVVSAPSAPEPPRNIRIEISGVPADENTGAAAFVDTAGVSIPVQTENVFITADNVSTDLGLDTRVVPRGTADVELLGVELANSDETVGKARIDTIAVSLLAGSGDLAVGPSRTLREFYALVGGHRVDGELNDANPVVFDFTVVPGGVVLDPTGPDSTASIVFAVSVLDNAELGEIVVSIENADDFVIRSVSAGTTVPVVDKDTRGSVTGRLRSQSLVILSSQFEEYAHNYPNPFRAGAEVTRIAYKAGNEGSVSVRIFDVMGELVYEKQYAPGERRTTAPGAEEVTWDGKNMKGEVVRNGIYICQVGVDGKTVRIRIAVAK